MHVHNVSLETHHELVLIFTDTSLCFITLTPVTLTLALFKISGQNLLLVTVM